MDDLRWALLGLGLLFIVGLTWWELRKPRHGGRQGEEGGFATEVAPRERVEPRFEETGDRELGNDELPSMRAIEIGGDPPVLVLDEMRDSPAPMNLSIADDVAVDSPGSSRSGEMQLREPPPEEVPPFDEPSGAALITEAEPSVRRGPPEPRWPPENQRRIVSLRLVPRPPARFPGRNLRLAFEASGLEFGAFDIFHLADDAGEVVASAANLMRPGSFAPDTMDGQHFHGVHLFCVLPGPLPAGRAVDELIALARDLAQRVSGIVLDEVGQPLDEERAATVRLAAQQAERPG